MLALLTVSVPGLARWFHSKTQCRASRHLQLESVWRPTTQGRCIQLFVSILVSAAVLRRLRMHTAQGGQQEDSPTVMAWFAL